MDLGLKDKVAVVTGGSRGIGFACAKELLKEGAFLAFCARDEAKIEEARQALPHPNRIFAKRVDMRAEEEVYAFAEEVAARFGKIDIWINNSGSIGSRRGEFFTGEEIDEVYAQCFKSAVFGAQAAARQMKKSGGSIVNISSLAARCPSAGRSTIYGPMKAAIRNLTITLAGELAAYGIRVNCVLPGFTLTELVKENISEEELLRNERGTLLKRLGSPEEIAKPVVFLASSASSYMTGESIEVSGGRAITLNPMYSYERKEKEEEDERE